MSRVPERDAPEPVDVDPFEPARAVADAVLHEGYLLYPYRASALKNQVRWQFGVLAPPAWAEVDGSEHAFSQTELLLEQEPCFTRDSTLRVRVRFLQVEAKQVEEAHGTGFRPVQRFLHNGNEILSWDHGIDRAVDIALPLTEPYEGEQVTTFAMPADRSYEILRTAEGAVRGRITRESSALSGRVDVSARRSETAPGLTRIRIKIMNTTVPPVSLDSRDHALRYSLVATHSMTAVEDGTFVSVIDPPDYAREDAESCTNLRSWPVLIGRGLMLSAPIVLDDHPRIAPESTGEFFDATEIDELLTLRTMTMTDEEKREARATDPKAAEIIDRVATTTTAQLSGLHGAVRSPDGVPWWSPEAEASVSPETDGTLVNGVELSNGSRVRLHPEHGVADAQDMFLEGAYATVHRVFLDVDDNPHLAVTLEDDPAAELLRWDRRFHYFGPDEVEPVDPVDSVDSVDPVDSVE